MTSGAMVTVAKNCSICFCFLCNKVLADVLTMSKLETSLLEICLNTNRQQLL